MDSVSFAAMMLAVAVAVFIGLILIVRALMHPTAGVPRPGGWFARKDVGGADDSKEDAVAPHRMERLRHVHDQCKTPPRSYHRDDKRHPQ